MNPDQEHFKELKRELKGFDIKEEEDFKIAAELHKVIGEPIRINRVDALDPRIYASPIHHSVQQLGSGNPFEPKEEASFSNP